MRKATASHASLTRMLHSRMHQTAPLRRSSSIVAPDVTLYTGLSTFPAFNGWKLTILLEELVECGAMANFNVRELDLDAMEHKEDWFLDINPNGRIPALIDHNNNDLPLFESGAIMMYLADRYRPAGGGNGFLPQDSKLEERYAVLQWFCFQLSGVGPMQGQAHAFTRYVPTEIPYAIARYQTETKRLYEVLDKRLQTLDAESGAESKELFVGGEGAGFSIADVALFPWVAYHDWAGVSIDEMPHLQRWIDRIAARPAVKRGLQYNPKDIKRMLAEADNIRDVVGRTTLDKTKGSKL